MSERQPLSSLSLLRGVHSKVIQFPRFRGVIVEIADCTLQLGSDGSHLPGYVIHVINHPRTGTYQAWLGLFRMTAEMQANEILADMPGAKLCIDCVPDDGEDDPENAA